MLCLNKIWNTFNNKERNDFINIKLIFKCYCLHLTDFVRHQSIPIQSMSADIFAFKEDIFVAMAAPISNSCVVMEWDHIEMNFRKFDNITGLTVVFSLLKVYCQFTVKKQ